MKKITCLLAGLSILAITAISPHAPSYADERGDADHTHDGDDEDFILDGLSDDGRILFEERNISNIPPNESPRERRNRKSEEAREFRKNTRERRRTQKEEIREIRKTRGPLQRDLE